MSEQYHVVFKREKKEKGPVNVHDVGHVIYQDKSHSVIDEGITFRRHFQWGINDTKHDYTHIFPFHRKILILLQCMK